ncbi:hypothetical protein ACJX0J_013871 [Zea mays]
MALWQDVVVATYYMVPVHKNLKLNLADAIMSIRGCPGLLIEFLGNSGGGAHLDFAAASMGQGSSHVRHIAIGCHYHKKSNHKCCWSKNIIYWHFRLDSYIILNVIYDVADVPKTTTRYLPIIAGMIWTLISLTPWHGQRYDTMPITLQHIGEE